MRRANIVGGALLIVFGLVMLVWIIPGQIEEGPPDIMSPRLVPNMMMGLIIALSVLLVATNLLSRGDPADEDTKSPISRAEVLSLVKHAAVFGVALAFYYLGSPLAAGIALIGGSLIALGERRPLVVVLMPATILMFTWLLFYKVLGTAIV